MSEQDTVSLSRLDILDEKLYGLDANEAAFFKSQTGIQDNAALKKHIIKVQADAYKVFPYPCIRRFAFTKLKISRLPAYQDFLRLGRERSGAIYLDIGCCFGNDVRKAIVDGYPMQNSIASDLHTEFWELGHKLFNSTPETFPVVFLPGDAFDPKHLEETAPFVSPPSTPVPQLTTLTSLNPLRGHISAIHASAFFHLFDEAAQLQLARSVAGLLSPVPGSMIFGSHGGLSAKGTRTSNISPSRGNHMFCHSPESWTELWDGTVFPRGAVRVEAQLVKSSRPDLFPSQIEHSLLLVWSVTRL